MYAIRSYYVPSQKNGRRIACIGAGPASLTVARDLAPLGYEVSVFDQEKLAGGMIRSQIPRFRLPVEVIDEEVGYIIDRGVAFYGGVRINSMKKLLEEGYDAIFVITSYSIHYTKLYDAGYGRMSESSDIATDV